MQLLRDHRSEAKVVYSGVTTVSTFNLLSIRVSSTLTVLMVVVILACSKQPSSPPPSITIHQAAQEGDVATIRDWLQRDSSLIHAEDDLGRTPLMRGAEYGQVQAVELLLSEGALPDVVSRHHETAMYLAASGPIERVEHRILVIDRLLAEGVRLDVTQEEAKRAAFGAAVMRDYRMLRHLVSRGAELSDERIGITALHKLAESRSSEDGPNLTESVQTLLDAGIDLEVRTRSGKTPLFYAALLEDLPLVQVLVEHGADINVIDSGGDSALIAAVRSQSVDIVRFLVEQGADVNRTGNLSITPAQLARQLPNDEIARFLDSYSDPGSD